MIQVLKNGRRPRVLVVVAHPDDESFGVGAIIAWLRRNFVPVNALIFTQGETSTLGSACNPDSLRVLRCKEFECASRVLDLTQYVLLSCPDGHLLEVPLTERVQMLEEASCADAVLAFDETGITGHHDHIAASEAAKAFAINHGLPLYFWTLPEGVASVLNEHFGTSFRGRPENQITLTLNVAQERERQWRAICCHESQADALGVVRARLELLCGREYLVESYQGNLGGARG